MTGTTVLGVIFLALFLIAVVRVSMRWGADRAIDRLKRPPASAPPVRGFPVIRAEEAVVASESKRLFRVRGTSGWTGDAVELRLAASDEADATRRAAQHSVVATEVTAE